MAQRLQPLVGQELAQNGELTALCIPAPLCAYSRGFAAKLPALDQALVRWSFPAWLSSKRAALITASEQLEDS